MTTQAECSCRCHSYGTNTMIECNVDDGSSGVPGKKSCGYHETNSAEAESINKAKFKASHDCRKPHGDNKKAATFGMLCDHHEAELRDLVADVHDLCKAYAEGDAITPEPSEHRGKNPHPPLPIRVNQFIIGNPGGEPVICENEEEEWARYGNPKSGRLESNGPDAPAIIDIMKHWAARIVEDEDIEWPWGDTLDKLVFIRANLKTLTYRDDYSQFLHEMRACRRALASAIGEEPGPQPITKCPNCRAPLFTDKDREVIRRRRAGELISGEDAEPITARADRVACHCHPRSEWSGAGLIRLKLIAEAS